MAEEYEIEITPQGIRLDARGFQNKACLKELAEIERMLKDLGIETTLGDQKLKRNRARTTPDHRREGGDVHPPPESRYLTDPGRANAQCGLTLCGTLRRPLLAVCALVETQRQSLW